MSPALMGVHANLSIGLAHFPTEFDMGTWNTLPGSREATDVSFHPTLLETERSLTVPQGALFPINPSTDVTAFFGVNTQIPHAQIPYTGVADRFGNARPEPAPALDLPGHITHLAIGSYGSNGNVCRSVNMPGSTMAIHSCHSWANTPVYRNDANAKRAWANTGNVPVHNGPNITPSCLRFRLPPQTYEGDIRNLHHRLIREGADPGAAAILRDIIFAGGVTVEALMAPIQTREMSNAYGGANRAWHLLLEVKEVARGERKYCCLLCPLGNRKEYKHERDSVRHFHRDHFGFCFTCDYW
jgi:hypothetical protein